MDSSRKRSSELTKATRTALIDKRREARKKAIEARQHVKVQSASMVKAVRSARELAAAKKAVIMACVAARTYLFEAKKEVRAIAAKYHHHAMKIAKLDETYCELAGLAAGTQMDSGNLRDALIDALDSEVSIINDYHASIE